MPELGPSRFLAQWRMYVTLATILATGLAYSFHLTSFLHAKVLVLAIALFAMGMTGLYGGVSLGGGMNRLWPLFVFALFELAAIVPDLIAVPVPPEQWLVFLASLLLLWNVYPLLATEENRHRVSSAVVATGIIAAVLAIGQYANLLPLLFPRYPGASNLYSVFGNSGLLGGYIAIATPLLLARYMESSRINPLHIFALSLMVGVLLLTGARTAWLACAVGCFVILWPGTLKPGRVLIFAVSLLAASTICVLYAPEQTIVRASNTFGAADTGANLRWWFWAATVQMIRDHIFVGVGVGNFVREAPAYLGGVLWAPEGERYARNILFTEHPHNELLMIWAETGLMGLALSSLVFFRLSRYRGVEWGGLIALLVFAMFNYPFHSVPHLLSGLLLTGCLFSRGESARKNVHWGYAIRVANFVLVSIVGVGLVYFVVWPSFALRSAQTAHIEGRPSFTLYERAIASRPGFAAAHESYGVALMDAGDFERAREQFELALRTMDTGSAYLGLGTTQMKLGNRNAAKGAFQACVRRWPSHFDAWRLLISVTPSTERELWLGRAERFLSGKQVRELRNIPAG